VSAEPGKPPERAAAEPPRRARRWRIAAAAGILILVGSAPFWGPRLLAKLEFFRVRSVEIEGARYLAPESVLARLRVDTTMSVWGDLAPLERRVAEHPQVREVRIERRLPGTLVVHVAENLPVALVPAAEGFRTMDADGRTLPIDPSKMAVDLPILARPDTGVLRLLGEVQRDDPALFERISEVRRVGKEELVLRLTTVPVRAMADVSVGRLAEVFPVEEDLARRGLGVAELDLRFRDQVIARLQ
jgi:cell division protein FtsQ